MKTADLEAAIERIHPCCRHCRREFYLPDDLVMGGRDLRVETCEGCGRRSFVAFWRNLGVDGDAVASSSILIWGEKVTP
jgi:hypothetical protein